MNTFKDHEVSKELTGYVLQISSSVGKALRSLSLGRSGHKP